MSEMIRYLEAQKRGNFYLIFLSIAAYVVYIFWPSTFVLSFAGTALGICIYGQWLLRDSIKEAKRLGAR